MIRGFNLVFLAVIFYFRLFFLFNKIPNKIIEGIKWKMPFITSIVFFLLFLGYFCEAGSFETFYCSFKILKVELNNIKKTFSRNIRLPKHTIIQGIPMFVKSLQLICFECIEILQRTRGLKKVLKYIYFYKYILQNTMVLRGG